MGRLCLFRISLRVRTPDQSFGPNNPPTSFGLSSSISKEATQPLFLDIKMGLGFGRGGVFGSNFSRVFFWSPSLQGGEFGEKQTKPWTRWPGESGQGREVRSRRKRALPLYRRTKKGGPGGLGPRGSSGLPGIM